jgi:ArsR family transcriptional regulator
VAGAHLSVDARRLFGYIAKQENEMNDRIKNLYDDRARIIKAMAHPTRLFMIEELARGERCVCELQEKIGADTSTVSKHLSVLKNAGIVQDDKRGLQVFYRLRVPCILNFMKCVEAVMRNNADRQSATLRR